MIPISLATPSRAKAWLRTAASPEADLNGVYLTLTHYGSCLVSTDKTRLHLDWRPNSPEYNDLPIQYVQAVQNLLRHLNGMHACSLLIEAEFNRVWEAYARQPLDSVDAFTYALPGAALDDVPLPRLWLNGVHWLEALSGFQGIVQFWYHPANPAHSPIAIGTPGVRLAMLMPTASLS